MRLTSRRVTAMNKKPVSYLQTDARWKSKPYRVKGETSTIGSAGCGPTCAAMVIATLANKSVTPVETCAWSVAHGYKALNQGTYYSYFKPQMAAYGIECRQLLSSRIINQPNHPIHDQVKDYLAKGYYVIALMGPGTWTTGGHFVLLWGWDDKVRINDPASTKDKRLNGDPATFRNEARCYWLVDARAYNNPIKETTEEDDEVVRYERLSNIPASNHFRDIVDDLMTAGVIAGDGSDPDGNNDVIDLSHDMVRMLIFNYRAGVYDEALRTAGVDPERYK